MCIRDSREPLLPERWPAEAWGPPARCGSHGCLRRSVRKTGGTAKGPSGTRCGSLGASGFRRLRAAEGAARPAVCAGAAGSSG
eukprot:1447727-Alexandrium_andersonii.AAC.1